MKLSNLVMASNIFKIHKLIKIILIIFFLIGNLKKKINKRLLKTKIFKIITRCIQVEPYSLNQN
jgi:hypothetical protein